MASETINNSSSFVGPARSTGYEEMNSTSSSNRSRDPTDPLSCVDEYPPDDMFFGIADSLTEEVLQASSIIPTLHDGSSSNQHIPSTVDNVNLAGTPSAQPELSMMSLSDFNFNSMDLMGNLLNFDPILFSNDFQHTIGSMVPGLAAPTDAAVFSFDADNFLNTVFPTNLDGSSSSSSSWLTQSPVVDHTQNLHMPMHVPVQQVSPDGSAGFIDGHEIDELTTRARQVVGLTTAQSPGTRTQPQPNKLPIPRLQHPVSTTGTSGPGAEVRASNNASPFVQAGPSPSPSSGSMNSRTKLSHCTVERRYRTNMKEHIKNLRDVVPALRVLELKPGNRISNLSLKPGTLRVGIDADPVVEGADVVDERGFIDGVKVAHNGSKTTAVLKTIEYIRVLKRRELRLKREQEGLKALVRSFTGGLKLLQQWEMMWQEKYGGPEKDELDGEDRKTDNEDFDGVDDGEDEPSMSGRDNRKRAKTDISSSTLKKVKKTASVPIDVPSHSAFEAKKYVPIMPAQASLDSSHAPFMPVPAQPEKRKRGRPRKVPLPPLAAPNGLVHEALVAQQQQQRPIAVTSKAKEETVASDTAAAQTESLARVQHQDAQSDHCLLAVFAFLSFFNTSLPFSSTSSFGVNRNTPFAQAHSGSVMVGPRFTANTTALSDSPIVAVAVSWRDAVQLAHLTFSVFLLFSVMRPRLLRVARLFSRHLYSALCGLHAASGSLATSSALELSSVEKSPVPSTKLRVAAHKLRALSKDHLLVPAVEAQVLREALGLRTGFVGLVGTLVRLVGIPEKHDCWRVERRGYTRLAELVALDANAPTTARLQICISAFRFRYGCTYCATEIAILALVIQPIWHSKGARLWEKALGRVRGRGSSSPYIYKTYEMFVLESMSIDDAALRISRLDRNAGARILTSAAHDGASKGEDWKHREFASPLAVLARQAVHDQIRAQAERVFLQTVSGEQDDCACLPDEIDGANFDSSRLLAAGRSLDPLTAALVDFYDQVCNSRTIQCDAAADLKVEGEILDEWGDTSGAYTELQTLLEAIVLYRRIFVKLRIRSGRDMDARCRSPGSEIFATMTPPSSPCRRNDVALKRCLNSAAFDCTDALKKARSRVMDMMTED